MQFLVKLSTVLGNFHCHLKTSVTQFPLPLEIECRSFSGDSRNHVWTNQMRNQQQLQTALDLHPQQHPIARDLHSSSTQKLVAHVFVECKLIKCKWDSSFSTWHSTKWKVHIYSACNGFYTPFTKCVHKAACIDVSHASMFPYKPHIVHLCNLRTLSKSLRFIVFKVQWKYTTSSILSHQHCLPCSTLLLNGTPIGNCP